MIFFHVLWIFEIFSSVNCDCSSTSWVTSFDNKGQSKCKESNYFMKGLERGENSGDDGIQLLDGVECCSAPQQWSNIDALVVYADWTLTLDTDYSWAHCPQGYFLQGLYRSTNSNYLDNIEAARCAKPATHPSNYASCYEENIMYSFDRQGKVSCKEGHYITGLYRSNGRSLNFLDKLKCCSMAESPQVINSDEYLIERTMATTLSRMAKLADMLGYGYCYGNRGVNISEDFERNENTWEASKKLFWPDKNCEGIKCDQRLNLAFGDWSIGVKEIVYGKSVVDDLQPETVDSGTLVNAARTSITEVLKIPKTVQETVTHSATSNWTSSRDLGISLNFDVPFDGSSSESYTFKYAISSAMASEQSKQNSKTLTLTETKEINANSIAKYKINVYKSRITISYTAVLIVKFSTEFRGFMKYGGLNGSLRSNYHNHYATRTDRPTFNYRFGNSSVPFYEALKSESEYQSRPWLWNDLLINNPTAQQIINSLTDETQYTFFLNGTLSKVAGTKLGIVWEFTNRSRRETPDLKKPVEVPNSNVTIKAVAGPNDPPPKVVYPEVSLTSNQTYVPDQVPVNKAA